MNINPNASTENDQHGEECTEAGHVFGCTGRAGGEHHLDPDYFADPSWFEDEDGYVREPFINRGDLNREGDPAFNGAFDRW